MTITDTAPTICKLTLLLDNPAGRVDRIDIPNTPRSEVILLQTLLAEQNAQLTIWLYDLLTIWAQTVLPDHGDALLPQLEHHIDRSVKLSLAFEDNEILLCTVQITLTGADGAPQHTLAVNDVFLDTVPVLQDMLSLAHDNRLTRQAFACICRWAVDTANGFSPDTPEVTDLVPHIDTGATVQVSLVPYSTRPYYRPQAA